MLFRPLNFTAHATALLIMAGNIPKSFIDDLLNRTDIVDVIDARVPLKKKGANYTACCPFHSEKTPSFTVSQDKQFYHCFGCGAHGTAVGFLMEYDRLDFVSAIEELAKQLGLAVPREESPEQAKQRKQNVDLYGLMEMATKHYELALKGAPQAIDYLKRRNISGEIAKRFGIGYAPDGWDFILSRLGKSAEDKAKLVSAGMVIQKDEGKTYDRFRDRLMFPIRDARGKYIGFGGRVLGQGEPKYLNSPETPIYHKGKELYGLYEAKHANKKLTQAIVVEGYMDVVMLAEFGITHAVASLGTACTGEQIQRLFRTVDEVIFCFDGDRAGKEAAWRALNNALPELQDSKLIKFLFLPDGEDPDSIVQKEGKDGFEARVQSQSISLSQYLIDHLKSQVDFTHMDGISQLIAKATSLLDSIDAPTFKTLLKSELAKLAGTSVTHLFGDNSTPSAPLVQDSPQEPSTALAKHTPSTGVQLNIKRFLVMALLSQSTLAMTVDDSDIDLIDTLDDKGIGFIVDLLDLLRDHPNLSTPAILERFKGTEYEQPLHDLLVKSEQALAGRDEDKLAEEFQDAFAKLIKKAKQWHHQRLCLKPLSQLTEDERAFLNTALKDEVD